MYVIYIFRCTKRDLTKIQKITGDKLKYLLNLSPVELVIPYLGLYLLSFRISLTVFKDFPYRL